MSDKLPPPMTPPDCDLRDFAHMQFDVARFRDSEFAAIEDDGAFRAGVMALAVCWHQLPAASLPDDDRQLAKLLGYGRDVDLWKRVRATGALHGFVLCADGRLYHVVVAEKACAAWAAKQRAREAGIKGNRLRWGKVVADQKPNPPAITQGSAADRHPIATQSQDDCNSIGEQSQGDRKRERDGEVKSLADFAGAKPLSEEASQKSERAPKGWVADMGFAAFRAAYPKPDRAPARTYASWQKALKLTSAADIMAGMAAHPFNPDEKYRPDPATWLNGQSWFAHGQGSGKLPAVRAGAVKTSLGQVLSLDDLMQVPT